MFFELLRKSLEEVMEGLAYPVKTLDEIYSFKEIPSPEDFNLVEEIARSLGVENSRDLREVIRRVLEDRE